MDAKTYWIGYSAIKDHCIEDGAKLPLCRSTAFIVGRVRMDRPEDVALVTCAKCYAALKRGQRKEAA